MFWPRYDPPPTMCILCGDTGFESHSAWIGGRFIIWLRPCYCGGTPAVVAEFNREHDLTNREQSCSVPSGQNGDAA